MRRRRLTPEDRELWSRVARSANPLASRLPDAAPEVPTADPTGEVHPAAPSHPRTPLPPFRVGETAASRPLSSTAHHPAPGPAARLAAAPLRMDAKTHRKMAKGKLRPEARIDLHGMTLATAHPELIHFVLSCHASGLRLVLVITGKGRGDHGPLPFRSGALRHQVPHWLSAPPLAGVVQQVTPANIRHGGEGAYYIYLRRLPGAAQPE